MIVCRTQYNCACLSAGLIVLKHFVGISDHEVIPQVDDNEPASPLPPPNEHNELGATESVFSGDNEMSQDENDDLFSGDSQSHDGEEVWEESDESCMEECPELPSAAQKESEEENAILQWLLLFLLRLQAKHYIPDAAIHCLLKFLYIFCVFLVDILIRLQILLPYCLGLCTLFANV